MRDATKARPRVRAGLQFSMMRRSRGDRPAERKKMDFIVTYRAGDGALHEERVNAASRAECVAHCRRRGIAPIRIAECGSKAETGTKPYSPIAIWKVVVLAVGIAAIACGALWWYGGGRRATAPSSVRGDTRHPRTEKSKEVRSVKSAEKPLKPTERREVSAVANAVPPKPRSAASEPESRPTAPDFPSIATNTPMVPALPPPTFDNSSDQLLAMALSSGDGSMPPMPIGKNAEAEFLASLKKEVVILDTDDEQTRKLKEAVKATRDEMKRLIDGGMSVEQVLREHQDLANENAKIRDNATAELRQIVESGDIESAKKYKRKINIALQQMGISELTLPVTDEERAERAAARRERMLKRRAAQADAARQN